MSESHKYKVALIACYFGDLPSFAPLVFRSIAENPTITWILVVDRKPALNLPKNVILKEWKLSDLSAHFSKVLKTDVMLLKPYQICNLRPSFGLVFEEYLKGYDFWGHTDMDVIFGNLRSFIPEFILDNYDRVYARGHLSMFRNNPQINKAFECATPGIPDIRKIFSNPAILPQFDEWPGIWKIFRYHRIPQYHAEVIADIKPPNLKWITRFEAEELPNYPSQVFYWHEGKTFQAYYHREGGLFDREVAYIHFQKRDFPAPAFQPDDSPGFLIGPDGFCPYDRENLSPEEMDQLNSARRRPWREVIRRRILRIQRVAKRVLKS